jgi:2-oxoglutarate ferredoxin oxidoreductase subunit gamma
LKLLSPLLSEVEEKMSSNAVANNKTQAQTQIRIGGYGGQGIVLAGMLLGKAASLFDGKEAVFTQAYGPEARGGASNADVIISEQPVDYPYVTAPDVVAVLFQEAYTRFEPLLKPGGVLIIEQDLVRPDHAGGPVIGLPATRMAEELGNKLVTNVVLLGYLVGVTGVVSPEAVKQAIRETVKERVIELDLRAFEAGYERALHEKDDCGAGV